VQTWSQYAEAAIAIGKRRWYGKDQVPLYIPDFTRCVDHFCLHAGERCVLLFACKLHECVLHHVWLRQLYTMLSALHGPFLPKRW
jgi:hypothetical protein